MACVVLLPASLFADPPEPPSHPPPSHPPTSPDGVPTLRSGRIPENFRLDGELDEPAWAAADAITELTVTDPVEGAQPAGRTTVRVLADATAVVVGFVCGDPDPAGIVSRSMARDASLRLEDHVRVVFGTFQDGRSGYVFAVNPSGARYDALVSDRGEGENSSWDGIWEAKTARDAKGWSVEIRIPIRTLSFKRGLQAWHFNVSRNVQRLAESSRWAFPQRNYRVTQTSRAGLLTDLPDFDLGLGLSVRPAGVARVGHAGPEEDVDPDFEASLDVTQRLGPDLLASLTVNTDFAETEVDTRRSNLTRFPLFFPEKRTFFLEGADAFDFGLGLGTDVVPFHSRRIGLANGREIPLHVGGKVHGRVADTSVGALAVRTGREEDLEPADTENTLGAVRVRQNVLEESSVGLLATSGDPLGRDDGSWMGGGDFTYQTSRFLGDKNLLAGIWGLTMDRDDLDGGSRSSFGGKIDYPNGVWDARAGYKRIGEDFDPSLGFVPRRGIHKFEAGVDWSPRPGWTWVHDMDYGINGTYVMNLDHVFETYRVTATPLRWDLASGDYFGFSATAEGDRLPGDFEIDDGVVIPAAKYDWVRYQARAGTASKRALKGEIEWSFGPFYDGRLDTLEALLRWNPVPLLTIEATGEKNTGRLDGGRFTQDVYGARVRFNISPDFNISTYTQYDTESRTTGTFARLHWTPTPVTDVFLVATVNWADEENGIRRRSDEVVLKVQYTFRF